MGFRHLVVSSSVIAGSLLVGCAAPPAGLASTPQGDGPKIVWDLLRQPLPELPFPNDIATRPDSSSPTGLRINASLVASTDLEGVARKRIDQLSGFGVYEPLQVRFDAPIDIHVIYDRHRDYRTSDDASDYEFGNDAVYLIDVTPDSPGYQNAVPLDFGEGNFPVLLRTPSQYWEHDPKTITKALTLETYDEDWNGNGELEPAEDIDLDGVLDRPNYHVDEDGKEGLDPNFDLVSFYEFETNTLLFRPILPLREKTTYAVVITDSTDRPQGQPGSVSVSLRQSHQPDRRAAAGDEDPRPLRARREQHRVRLDLHHPGGQRGPRRAAQRVVRRGAAVVAGRGQPARARALAAHARPRRPRRQPGRQRLHPPQRDPQSGHPPHRHRGVRQLRDQRRPTAAEEPRLLRVPRERDSSSHRASSIWWTRTTSTSGRGRRTSRTRPCGTEWCTTRCSSGARSPSRSSSRIRRSRPRWCCTPTATRRTRSSS